MLETLGTTPEQVAKTLTRMGIRGKRRSCRNCPIVNVWNRFYNSPWGGVISPACGVLTYNDPQILDPDIPRPVKEFMILFDEGEFPELEEKVVQNAV